MSDLNNGFEVDELVIGEVVSVSAGAYDPSIALLDRPLGSLYLRTNGELWKKTGALPNAWTLSTNSGTGGSSLTNLDGGRADSVYGSVTAIDGGGADGS